MPPRSCSTRSAPRPARGRWRHAVTMERPPAAGAAADRARVGDQAAARGVGRGRQLRRARRRRRAAGGDFGSERSRRGLEEIERRGWDSRRGRRRVRRAAAATNLALAAGTRSGGRRARARARSSNALDGERPALNREVFSGVPVADAHRPAHIRPAALQADRRRAMEGGYGEDGRCVPRARPVRADAAVLGTGAFEGEHIGERLARSTCRCCSRSTRAACSTRRGIRGCRRRASPRTRVRRRREAAAPAPSSPRLLASSARELVAAPA